MLALPWHGACFRKLPAKNPPALVNNKKTRPTAAPSMAGAVRIIAGQYKRRKLPIATKNHLPHGFRPSPDRLRETVFNWLGQIMHGYQCIDAFAGTGALGFEAASRGASSVYMFESHAGLVAQLQYNKKQLDAQSVHIRQGDALAYLQQLAHSKPAHFDVVFLDPPYASNLYTPALQAIAPILQPLGYVYLEADHKWQTETLAALGWVCWRYTKAGAAHAHMLRFLTSETA